MSDTEAKVYIRLDDEEVFIKDRKTGMFYNKGMQCFKDKGHLVSEFTEEHLDSLVEKGLFKRVTESSYLRKVLQNQIGGK